MKRVVFVVMANVGLLCAIEGLASAISVAQVAAGILRPTAERVYTAYDPEIGWTSRPNIFVRDMYGPGVSLRTNAQGFRNDEPVPATAPASRVRVVCSGDSFTLGYGVSNAEAWCNRLATLDPRLDTVNMGQGGYGVDQAYLWYRRDGTKIAHDVQLFAFITDDFARMRGTAFLGYPKPVLTVENGQLHVGNVPVPRRSELVVKLHDLAGAMARLRTVELMQSWIRRGPAPTVERPTGRDETTDPEQPVVAGVFEALRDLHRKNGSLLVLVYLPTRTDYDDGRSDAWRAFVRAQAERQEIPLIDLTDALRAVPPQEVGTYFIKPGELPYLRAEGHYTVRGNEFVARTLHQKLLSIESVSARMNSRATRP